MRLIDIEPFETEKDVTRCQIARWRNGDGYADMVVTNTKDIPTIETEPKRGRWVLKERAHYFKCSLCKEPIPYKFGYADSRRYYNFCPNCGAKMDAERKGDDD